MGDQPQAAGVVKAFFRVPDELAWPFGFESNKHAVRTARAARAPVITLLHRLEVPDPEQALAADKRIERQLLLFGTEVLLNIDYYYARSHREERKQWAMNAGIYGLAIGFVGFALYAFFRDREAAMASSSQIAAVVGAVLAGVKFLTESQDFQKTRSSFWQAGAELKMRLYTFLGEWCGRAWNADDKAFTPEFVLALQDEIKASRDLQLEERRRFYDLMASPTRLVGATQQLTGDAQAAVGAYVEAQQVREQQRRAHELEQLGRERDRLYQTYPDDATRPAAVTARLGELDLRERALNGEGVTTTLTAQVETSTSTATASTSTDAGGGGGSGSGSGSGGGGSGSGSGSGASGVPYDGRRDR